MSIFNRILTQYSLSESAYWALPAEKRAEIMSAYLRLRQDPELQAWASVRVRSLISL